MPISFNCPKCKKKLSVQDNLAGKVAKCPCGAKIKIPARNPQAAQPQTAQPQAAQPQTGQQPAQPLQPLGQSATPGNQPSAFDAANLQGLNSPGAMDSAPLAAGGQMADGGQLASGGQLHAQTAGQPVPMQAPENLQNLNPEFQIQCIQCGQQYQMRPELFGQTVACKCGAPIRFDDPLGAGGSMINHDPLGLGEVMKADPSQPLAYQSVSQPSQSKRKAKQHEEDVLKMYIKDEEEFEKVTKKKPSGKSGGGAVSGLKSRGGQQNDGELSVTKVISAIVALVGIFALGISMIIVPDATGDMDWGEGGAKGLILKIIWCLPTGIVLVSIGAVLVVLGCIMPKKILLFLASGDDDDDDDE